MPARHGEEGQGGGAEGGTVTWSLVSIKKQTENRVESIEKKINAAYFDIIACVARRRRSNPMAPPELEPRFASAEVVDMFAGCPRGAEMRACRRKKNQIKSVDDGLDSLRVGEVMTTRSPWYK